MSAHGVLAVQGPAERVHDGWDGRSRPMHRLDLPCGCRASDIRADAPPILGSVAHRTQYMKYYVCNDHYRAALERSAVQS